MNNKETLNELKAWCASESPMTKFVRSLRLEVADPEDSGKASAKDGVEGEKTPFDDIDLDSLPDDQKAHITKAKDAFVEQQKATKAATAKQSETEKFARDQQARADKASALLKKHNLDDSQTSKSDPDDITKDPVYKQMHKELLADGLKPESASAYAKMFARSGQIQRKEIMAEIGTNLGPLAGSINEVHADKLYRQVINNDESGIFEIPEVQKAVQDNINLFIENGRTVDEPTIKNLAAMAFGEHAMRANKEGSPVTTQRRETVTKRGALPNFGATHSGHFAGTPTNNANNIPIPVNADTAAAVAATVAHFKPKGSKTK